MKRLLTGALAAVMILALGGCAPTPAEQEAINLVTGIKPALTALSSYNVKVRQAGVLYTKYDDPTPIEAYADLHKSTPLPEDSSAIDYYYYTGHGAVDNKAEGGTAVSYKLTEDLGGYLPLYTWYYQEGVAYKAYEHPRFLSDYGYLPASGTWYIKSVPSKIRRRVGLEALLYETYTGSDQMPTLTAEQIESWTLAPTTEGSKLITLKLRADKLTEAMRDALSARCREMLDNTEAYPDHPTNRTELSHFLTETTPGRLELRLTLDAAGRPVRCDLEYDFFYIFKGEFRTVFAKVRDTVIFERFDTGSPVELPKDLSGYTDSAYVPKELW